MISKNNNFYASASFALLGLTTALCLALLSSAALAAGQTDEQTDYRLSRDGKTLVSYLGSAESFSVPDGIETIGSSAFATATNVKSVVIPESVFEIRAGAFNGASSLTSIEVAEDNDFFASKDGVLFTKDYFALVRYPAGRAADSYVVPEGVETIEDQAFRLCPSLKEIVLPESLKSIGERAFAGCSSLESSTIPGFVEYIGEAPFIGCPSLATFDVSEDSVDFCSIDGVLFTKDHKTLVRYPEKRSGDSYVAPDAVEAIAPFAFSDCAALKSVVLPEGLKSIGKTAFINCAALESISIPQSVGKIEDLAFDSCSSMKRIDVVDENPAYVSIDGVLFTKNGTTLIRCPEGIEKDSYVVPDGVKTIADKAFSHCKRLQSIVVSEGVRAFKAFAFQLCESLKTIDVPESVTTIEDNCFPGQFPDFTIRGERGSYVEEYAAKFHLRFEAIERVEANAAEEVVAEDDGEAKIHIVVVVSTPPEFKKAGLKWQESVEDALAGSTDKTTSMLLLSDLQANMPAANCGGLGPNDVASYVVLKDKDAEPDAVAQVCRKISEESKWQDAIAVFVFAPAADGQTALPPLDIRVFAEALNVKKHRLVVVLEDLYSTSIDNFSGARATMGMRSYEPKFLPKSEPYLKRFLSEAKGELFFRTTNFNQKALIETSVNAGSFAGTRFAAAFARFASNGCYLEAELNPVDFYNLLSGELCREVLNYNRWSRSKDVQQSLTQVDDLGNVVAIAPRDFNSLNELWQADAERCALLEKHAEFSGNDKNVKKVMTTVAY